MISIIIPHYCTKQESLDKCMCSVLEDNTADIEVIIVDDGSKTEYLHNLHGYLSDHRVKIITECHKGVSHARNVGIKEAQGDWLMFVDSDDYLDSGYYKILSCLTYNTDADFIFFNGYGEREGVQFKNHFFLHETIDYADSLEKKCQVMGAGLSLGRTPEHHKCLYTLGSPCSKLIRTEYIRNKKIEFDESVRFAEDTLFSMELVYNASHIYYADYYLYHYCINNQSVTGRYRIGLSKDTDHFFRKAKEFIEKNNLGDYLDESYYIRAFLEAQRCIRQEFYHEENVGDQNKKAVTDSFLTQEPYRTALLSKYPYMRELPCRIVSILLILRRYDLYMKMYRFLSKVKKYAHKR